MTDLVIEGTFQTVPPSAGPQRVTECNSMHMTSSWRMLHWEPIWVPNLDDICITLSAPASVGCTLTRHVHHHNMSRMMRGSSRVLTPSIRGFCFRLRATKCTDRGGFMLSGFWFKFFANLCRQEMMNKIGQLQPQEPGHAELSGPE